MFGADRKLKFGYFTSLSYFPCIGDTEDVVLNAKRKLEDAGHQVVPFVMPNIDQIMEILWDFAFADSGKRLSTLWYDRTKYIFLNEKRVQEFFSKEQERRTLGRLGICNLLGESTTNVAEGCNRFCHRI
jgi:Asp-tRNA(Asn)/Glu-tRNA(Gln) amidotransferase A subunit family amidase